jgi:hypothetical protein
MISAEVKDAIGQVIDYIDYFLKEREEDAPFDLNVYKPRGRTSSGTTQTVLTKCGEVQQKLIEIFELRKALPAAV